MTAEILVIRSGQVIGRRSHINPQWIKFKLPLTIEELESPSLPDYLALGAGAKQPGDR
jgi:hypothetical protein